MKRLRLLMTVFVPLFVAGTAEAQQVPEIAPHGWSMRVSTNSVYLTRPDLPYIQVAIVNDIRPDIPQDKKFDAAKAFFAKQAKCPALAEAQTEKSFAGYSATDDPDAPHCQLTAMGHWVKDGLQMALILNTRPSLGPRKDSYTRQAIVQDVIQLFTLRYQIAKAGQSPTFTAGGYAQLVPSSHKPVRFINLIDGTAKYRAILDAQNGTVGAPEFHAVILFPKEADGSLAWGSHCMDWDPAMFAPGDVLVYRGGKDCVPFLWRWKDGVEDGSIEARGPGQAEWKGLDDFEGSFMEVGGLYGPFKKGERLDIKVGADADILNKVAAGSLPASALGPHDLILTPDGRFIAGALRSGTLKDGGSEGGTLGSYYFDGHGVTLLLDDGRVVHGFAGRLPAETTLSLASALNINGGMYYTQCPEGVVCSS